MNFFKFVKNYSRLSKVLDELKYRKNISDFAVEKLEKSAGNLRSTISAHARKKMEFYKGKSQGYENSIIVIKKFINTGELREED